MEVPNYAFPRVIKPGVNNVFTLNPVTGDILWKSPQMAGIYNIAFVVVSWRKGKKIDVTIRDMQIFVADCDNNPPEIETIDRICVVAGKTVDFLVKGSDIDSADLVLLTALGAPLTSPYSPATFNAPTDFLPSPVTGTFHWLTACEHISNQPYSVVFKATD